MSRAVTHTAVLLAVLLAACSADGGAPEPSPTTATIPTSNAPATESTVSTPTDSPYLDPDETVRAWVRAWNAALRSGDTQALKQYEAPDCRNCASLSSVIDDVIAAGGSFSGGEWSIVASKAVELAARRVKVNVALAVGAGSTVNSAGQDPVHYEADKRIVVYELTQSHGRWLIDVIEFLS
jgi:hypothetical protein